jgi:hypothetical protein
LEKNQRERKQSKPTKIVKALVANEGKSGQWLLAKKEKEKRKKWRKREK